MKPTLLLSALLAMSLHAASITELFDALAHNPSVRLDALSVANAKIAQDMATAALYPKIDGMVGFDHYNHPTNLLPLPPNKILPMVKNPAVPQPFSTTIKRAGVTASMPLFVKSLFTLRARTQALHLSAQKRKKLQFLQKEAMLVAADAQWLYLRHALEALQTKERSLRTSLKHIALQVKSGRAPESARYKIEEALNAIAISENEMRIKIEQAKATIYELTGITLTAPVPLRHAGKMTMAHLFALEPLEAKARADALAVRAQREKLYPSLVARGSYFYNDADAYNNDKDIDEEYASYGIYLKMPLFDKQQYARIEQAKLQRRKAEVMIKKSTLELRAQARRLQAMLPLLSRSVEAARASAQNREKLLRIAKVSFENRRMSEEEYLRYEDARAEAQARVRALEATRWQTVAQLAVLYGNNLKGIVK